MNTILLSMGVGVFIGYMYATRILEKKIKFVFNKFGDEVHNQYLQLLKEHGVNVKN